MPALTTVSPHSLCDEEKKAERKKGRNDMEIKHLEMSQLCKDRVQKKL